MAPSTIRALTDARTFDLPALVSAPYKHLAPRLKKRAGLAWVRLQAREKVTCEEVGETLDLTHTRIVQFRQGDGAFAKALSYFDALERRGYDTSPLLEAIIETQMEARLVSGRSFCPRVFSDEEQRLDNQEDVDQHAAIRKEPGAFQRWMGSLAAYIAFVRQGQHAAGTEAVR